MTEKSKISVTDTKATIMKEYKALLSKYNEVSKSQLNPAKIKKTKKKVATMEKANGLSLDKVGTSIETLRSRTNSALDQLRAELEGELGNLHTIREAIELQNEEINELYGINKEAETLAALVQAQADRKAPFEEEMKTKRETFNEDQTKAKKSWDEEKAEFLKNQERETAEWKYNFERKQKETMDQLNDQIVAERKGWLAQKEADEKMLQERAETLIKQEDELVTMKQKVADFPAQLEAAKKEGEAKAGKSHGFETRTLKANHDAEVKVLQANVTTLTNENEGLRGQVQDLQNKLQAAYDKVQETASQALAAQGSANTVAQIQQAVEKASRSK